MKTQEEINKAKAHVRDHRGEVKYDDIGHYCTCRGKLVIRGSSQGGSYLYVCSGCGARTWSGL